MSTGLKALPTFEHSRASFTGTAAMAAGLHIEATPYQLRGKWKAGGGGVQKKTNDAGSSSGSSSITTFKSPSHTIAHPSWLKPS